MSVADICDVLKRSSPDEFSASQLCRVLGQDKSIWQNLKSLRKQIDCGYVDGFCYALKVLKKRGQCRSWVYWYSDSSNKGLNSSGSKKEVGQ